MDMVRFGRGIRALRMRRRWRQVDLGVAAGVSRAKVARVELAQSDGMPVRDLHRIAQALGARTDLRLSWNGEALDRLLDGDHARLVEKVAGILRAAGWEVVLEATFWIRGERGSVDVLGWHAASRTLLIVEVKSVVPDQQAMLASIDRKSRLAAQIGRERGWIPGSIAKLLVIRETRTSRRRIAAFVHTYETVFPHRWVSFRSWVARPESVKSFAGLIFLSDVQGSSIRHRIPRSAEVA